MLHDLQLAGLEDSTQQSYLRAVRKFAQWLKIAPDQASENDLRRYLLFIKNHQHWVTKPCSTPPRRPCAILASNPKYVGSSKLGFSGVLHTWGRTWNFHPHVHFIVPGGAISEDGQQWLPSRVDFFVPVKAASVIYRAKFLDCLAASGLADQARQAVGDKPWVVHSKAVGDGRQALRYLAP